MITRLIIYKMSFRAIQRDSLSQDVTEEQRQIINSSSDLSAGNLRIAEGKQNLPADSVSLDKSGGATEGGAMREPLPTSA
jgi:hypothetical protein